MKVCAKEKKSLLVTNTRKVLRACHDHVPLLVKKAFSKREIKLTDFYLQLVTLSDYFLPFYLFGEKYGKFVSSTFLPSCIATQLLEGKRDNVCVCVREREIYIDAEVVTFKAV